MTSGQLSALSAEELIHLASAKYNSEVNLQMRLYLGQVDPDCSRVISDGESRIVSLGTSDGVTVAMYEVSEEGIFELIP